MAENLSLGTGRRKTAVARVFLRAGSGDITVNGKKAEEYFANPSLLFVVKQPLDVTDSLTKYDLLITTHGGGPTGQAGACRHGIARALVAVDESNRRALRANGFLTRDPRMVRERSMDDAAHGEDSSSPNGSAVSQCERGADGRVRIRLTNGSSFFISADFADRNGIQPGLELTSELSSAIESNAEELQAQKKALELLGRREHTAFELAQKLKTRGFSQEASALALANLRESGYLDDRRFAEAWVRSRLKRRPEGYPRLVAGLARKGVGRKTIASVLEAMFTEEESEKALAAAAEKILRRGAADETALLRKLTNLGFSYRQAKNHLQKLQ